MAWDLASSSAVQWWRGWQGSSGGARFRQKHVLHYLCKIQHRHWVGAKSPAISGTIHAVQPAASPLQPTVPQWLSHTGPVVCRMLDERRHHVLSSTQIAWMMPAGGRLGTLGSRRQAAKRSQQRAHHPHDADVIRKQQLDPSSAVQQGMFAAQVQGAPDLGSTPAGSAGC